jgi:OOP family OmpA-OmpF porin
MTREGHTVFLRGRVAGEAEKNQVNDAVRQGLGDGVTVVDAMAVGGVGDEGLAGRATALWPLFRAYGRHMWLAREGSFFLGRAEDDVVRSAVAARFAAVNQPRDSAVSVELDVAVAVEKAQKEIDQLMAGTTIEFEVASIIIRRDSLVVLNAIAARLLRFPQVRVRISGHTDSEGDRFSNKALSLARANAVRSYIASRNIAPSRMVAEGVGADRPVATNGTLAGRRQNRRIEFTVFRETSP